MPCPHALSRLRRRGAGALLLSLLPGLPLVAQATTPDAPPLAPPHLSYRAVMPAAPASDPRITPWRDSNRLVQQLGGHAGHVRGNGPAAPAAAAASRPASGVTR
jgi:hypothetical protein